MLSIAVILNAQEIPQQKSYTAPREVKQWVFLGNSETSKFEYEQKTMVRMDPSHLRIRIKVTPLKGSYYDMKRAKMWQQRSIQGYSDSLKLHPQFYYEGYEKYGYTIFEEEIDLSGEKYIILNAVDYDQADVLLAKWDNGIGVNKPVIEASAERMLIILFFKEKYPNWVKK